MRSNRYGHHENSSSYKKYLSLDLLFETNCGIFYSKDFLIYAIYNVQYTYECMENSKSTKKFVFVDNLGSRYMQISTLKRFMVHF